MKTQPNTMIRLLSTLVIACVMAAFYGQPAAAQTASGLSCNGCVKSKQIRNNGIKGKDLKSGISIGKAGNDGDFSVKSTAGTPTVILDGDTGTVTNSLAGNGLVKAWAKINPDGTIFSCWRCNMDPAVTRRLGPGTYVVDFLPLATDISVRPRSAIVDDPAATVLTLGIVSLLSVPASLPLSTVAVFATDNPATTLTDLPFTVVIY